ncbi:MAG: hypothetical protein PVJ67_06280 [Candidatus Pacearchaeota archaeon]|jgi:hypothetical protein
MKNKEPIEGCVHIIFRDGKPVNVFTHISKTPKNGVVHFKGDKIYTLEGFKKSHIFDKDEIDKKHKKKITVCKYVTIKEYKKLKEKIKK